MMVCTLVFYGLLDEIHKGDTCLLFNPFTNIASCHSCVDAVALDHFALFIRADLRNMKVQSTAVLHQPLLEGSKRNKKPRLLE